jgi:hypothetical protein
MEEIGIVQLAPKKQPRIRKPYKAMLDHQRKQTRMYQGISLVLLVGVIVELIVVVVLL